MLAAVSIGVLSLFSPKELLLTTDRIRLGGEPIATAATIEVAAEGSQVVARIGRREWRGAELLSPGPQITIEVAGKIRRTWPGSLRIRARGGTLMPVVRIELEAAVARVAAAEMPDAPGEAQRAQAIAARSYYRARQRTHSGFEFCDTTHCQLLQERAAGDAAVATAGRVLAYDGECLRAVYFRSCSGRTLRAAEVGWTGEAYPYPSVACEACSQSPVVWTRRLPAGSVPPEARESQRLAAVRQLGWSALPSNVYTVEGTGDGVVVQGKGEGHGVGLCQRGAVHLSRRGWDAAAILRHYFPETALVR